MVEQSALPGAGACGQPGAGQATIVSVEEVGNNWWQVVTRFTVEEGSDKPCCVAHSVGRALAV
jgi:hypothetical protein